MAKFEDEFRKEFQRERDARSYPFAMPFARISNWVNTGFQASGMMKDHWTDHRVLKVCEESGEVFSALHNWRGGNPRRIGQSNRDDVINELLDTAAAALCAVEHLTDHQCQSVNLLMDRANATMRRAGIEIRD